MQGVPKTVADLARGVESLERVVEELVSEWAPDSPPINASMSEIGSALVEDSDATIEQIKRIFEEVEVILSSGTESEKDAVATGFLEAVVSTFERKGGLTRNVFAHAGPAARAYIDEWNRFHGVNVESD